MGMDVYGKAPTSDEGEYFRANIFAWPGILDAIVATGVLPEELCAAMSYNDGAGPDAEQAIALADALEHPKESAGPTPAGARTLGFGNAVMTALGGPPVDQQSADPMLLAEFIRFCRASGGFEVC